MKRFIALVLSLVMALSLCVPAWAEGEAADPNNITADCENLPVANVTVLGIEDTIENGESVTIFDNSLTIDTTDSMMGADLGKFSLDAAYQFEPTETVEQAEASDYRYWHADFVVYADKDVPDNSMALAGYYEAWCAFNNYKWVALTNDGLPISANEEVRLVYGMGNGGISVNYEELCTYGNDGTGFLCGVADLGGNEGTTITVELRLYETEVPSEENGNSHNVETGRYAIIGTHSYTFGPVAVIGDAEYDSLQEAVDAAVNGDTITVMANGLSAIVNEAKFFTVAYDEGVTKEAAITAAEGYAVSENSGTYTIKKLHKVAFDNNGGSGELTIAPMVESEFTLPKCPFTAPANKQFKGWATSKDATEVLGATYKVTEDVTFYAIWEDVVVDVPVTDKENEKTPVKVEATVSGSTATINKMENLENVISDEVKTDSVTLDFSEVKGAVENTDGEIVETPVNTVVIPAAMVEDIVEVVASTNNNVNNLEIATANATVTFDTEATKAIGTNANNSAVTLTVDVQTMPTDADVEEANAEAFEEVMKNADEENAVLLSIDLTGATETDKLFSEGKAAGTVTVKVKIAEGMKSATLYYLKGNEVVQLGSYNADADGYITVTLWHFSEYVLLGSTEAIPTNNGWGGGLGGTTSTTDKTVTSADTFDAGIGMYVAMSVMAAAGSAVVLKKRED